MNAITRAKPKANSRAKGASFERSIAQELELLTGVKFARNLEQSRAVDHCDLIPSDSDWPFSLELKAYAVGTGCRPEWQRQSERAAAKTGKLPCVIYKYNRRPVRVSVPFLALGYDCPEWIDVSLDGLAYLARELMAETNSGKGRGASPRDRSSRRALAATFPRQSEQQTEQNP